MLPEPRAEQQADEPTTAEAGGAPQGIRLELDWSDMDGVADTICRSVPPKDALKLMNALLTRLKTLVPDRD